MLIVGETGTGKELVARAIHLESDRRDAPFVTVSCAALPEAVLETELFGHAAGAFPGASQARRGLFAEADRGTIFLDEVADLSLALQGKLLRVLESGEIRTVGSDASHTVDVRCIASTHADLSSLVRARTFREDLFFRLDVIPIRTVPLRERPEDLPLLIEHFLTRSQERAKEHARRHLTPDAMRVVEAHAWPGNVRELENVIQRLVVTTTHAEIAADAVRAALTPLTLGDPADALAAAHPAWTTSRSDTSTPSSVIRAATRPTRQRSSASTSRRSIVAAHGTANADAWLALRPAQWVRNSGKAVFSTSCWVTDPRNR